MNDRGGRQRLAVDRGVHPCTDQVVGGATDPLTSKWHQRLHELGVGLDEITHHLLVTIAHVGAHQPLAPALHLRPHRLGVPEQPAGEPCGQLPRQRLHDLDRVLLRQGVDQLGRERLDLGPAPADRCAGELALHQHSLLAVPRVVLGDHVDLVCSRHGTVRMVAGEHAAASLDVLQVAVASDSNQRVAVIAIHGLVRPHPTERGMHAVAVLVEGGVEQIEGRALSVRHVQRSRRSMICCAARAGETVVVSIRISAAVGGSYGESIPVKLASSPRRALA